MLLLTAVVGSGIMGERLAGGNAAIAQVSGAAAAILVFAWLVPRVQEAA